MDTDLPTTYPTNYLLSIIDINYVIKNLTEQNIDTFNDENKKIVIDDIIDVIKLNYLDIDDGVEYEYFVINL